MHLVCLDENDLLVIALVSALAHALAPSPLAHASLVVGCSRLDILHHGLDGVPGLVAVAVN